MHVSTKDVDKDGTHILTNVLEMDGAGALASENAALEAKVISVSRTASGGVQVQTSVSISEPAQEPQVEAPKPLSGEEEAQAYMESKGMSADEAKVAVEKFGYSNILLKRQKELDSELSALLSEK